MEDDFDSPTDKVSASKIFTHFMEYNDRNTILMGKITIRKLTEWRMNKRKNRKDIATTSGVHRDFH